MSFCFQSEENVLIDAVCVSVCVCPRHVHNKDWAGAQRVAEGYDPESVSDVLVEQAKFCFQQNELQKSEALLLRAQRPELAVQFYKVSMM